MGRFVIEKSSNNLIKLIAPVAVFVLIVAIFFGGVGSLSASTHDRQKESLNKALKRGIVYCYTLEGRYPESLDYLMENYGIVYDEDAFYVDYRAFGSNMFPEYTIIDLEN